MELAVAFLGMALALLILGGGQLSVDRLIASNSLERVAERSGDTALDVTPS
jgi:hypothetical protein